MSHHHNYRLTYWMARGVNTRSGYGRFLTIAVTLSYTVCVLILAFATLRFFATVLLTSYGF